MDVSMKVCGAARTVTGMCLLFETPDARFLVDCGMFQGPKTLKALNYEPFPFEPRGLDFVLLTHAHIDHSGLLPRLARQGFRGRIHATPATIDLCSCMLPDAGHIQESEVEILNRRNRRRGLEPVQPIYTAEDAERTLSMFDPVEYGGWLVPGRGVRARYWNAGHLLGSASIELEFSQDGHVMRLLVSGDIGRETGTLQPVPAGPVDGLDHLVVESTYGDEERPVVTLAARQAALAELVRSAAEQGGPLLIPSFAVERAQEVILDLMQLMAVKQIPATTVYLDSPLAARASRVFQHHARALDDGTAMRAALASPHLYCVPDGAESRRISQLDGFRIVIAGSGMCEAGRIREHLKAHLWDTRTVVVLVGYQATGTLGRLLQDGASRVRIHGETVRVGARIARIEGYSAHADAAELCRWIAARGPVAGSLFIVHGEPDAMDALARRVTRLNLLPETAVLRPLLDSRYRLTPAAVARPDAAFPRPRRAQPASVGQPDWHNARAALLLRIEEALDQAPSDAARATLLERLSDALRVA